MVIYKTSMVGQETLLSRLISCVDGEKIQFTEDPTFKGIGKIILTPREGGNYQIVDLDEKVEMVELDALGGLTIVRLGQLFSFLPTKSLKYNFYNMQEEIIGFRMERGFEKNKEYVGSHPEWGKSNGSIIMKIRTSQTPTKVGAIDKNGVIHQFHDPLSNEVIGKVEPLPTKDDMAYLAYAALELFFYHTVY